MNFNEAKEYALMQSPDFLTRAKIIGNKQSYVCPCCNNGKGENKTGITKINEYSDHPSYHCFRCDFTGDIFDLAKEFFNCNTSEAFQIVYDYLDIEIDKNYSKGYSISKEELKKFKENREKVKNYEEIPREQKDYLNYFRIASSHLDPSYLMNRGISEKTQRHYMIGTDPKWLNPVVVENYRKENKSLKGLYPSPRCIIPTSRTSYLARDIRPNLSKKQEEYSKQKVGRVALFNEKNCTKKDVVFLAEGEIDAISFYEGSNGTVECAGLGSTSNWRIFVSRFEKGGIFEGKAAALALDNDKAGKEAVEKIINGQYQEYVKNGVKIREKVFNGLIDLGVPYVVVDYDGKDPNMALVSDRAKFENSIFDSLKELKEKELEIENEEEIEI